MEEYFEDIGGGEETKLRDAGVKFDWDIKAARQKDFEEFEKTTAYDNYVTMWGKAYDRSAAEKGLKITEKE